MYKIPLADLKEKIVASGKLDLGQLDSKIKAKIQELSGLISEEGAAHIIANELGVQITDPEQSKLKIKEIYGGMKSITTVGKVTQKFDVREFQKGDSTGKVCSLVIGDETGSIRVVFWNEQVDLLNDVNVDTIIKVESAYVRDNNGRKEIHLGQRGELVINPEGEEIGEVRATLPVASYDRKKIGELTEDKQQAEVVGFITQIFDPRFFDTCPRCRRRVYPAGEKFTCNEHGEVEPNLSYVMNLVLDDNSSTIQTVFWKEQVQELVGKDISDIRDNPTAIEDLKNDLMGEQYKIQGTVKRNDMFNRLELTARKVHKADPKEELAKLEAQ